MLKRISKKAVITTELVNLILVEELSSSPPPEVAEFFRRETEADWEDVNIYRVRARDTDLAYDILSNQKERIWTTNDSGVIYILDLEENKKGRNLKNYREEAGLTQKELADQIGTTQQQIAKYEAGLQDMTVTRLIEIAKIFRINPENLID